MVRRRTQLVNGTLFTTKRNTDSVRSTQEILGKRSDLTSVTNANRAIVSMGIIVYRLLVVLELKRVKLEYDPSLYFVQHSYPLHQWE